jgi:hypothetical protein
MLRASRAPPWTRTSRRPNDQRDFVTRIVAPQVDLALFDHQPPGTLALPGIGKAELHGHAARRAGFR